MKDFMNSDETRYAIFASKRQGVRDIFFIYDWKTEKAVILPQNLKPINDLYTQDKEALVRECQRLNQ
jgi:hypothetical protein